MNIVHNPPDPTQPHVPAPDVADVDLNPALSPLCCNILIPNMFPGRTYPGKDRKPAPNLAIRFDYKMNRIFLDEGFDSRGHEFVLQQGITAQNYHLTEFTRKVWIVSADERRRIQLENARATNSICQHLEPGCAYYQRMNHDMNAPDTQQPQPHPGAPHQPHQAYSPNGTQPAAMEEPQPEYQQQPQDPIMLPSPPPPQVPYQPAHNDVGMTVVMTSQETFLDLLFNFIDKHIDGDDPDMKIIQRMYDGHKQLRSEWFGEAADNHADTTG